MLCSLKCKRGWGVKGDLLRVNCLEGLSVDLYLLVEFGVEELDPVVPFMHIMGILPEFYAVQQNGAGV